LTRPTGRERLIGPKPTNDKCQPLDPVNVWGDDHCWWLDRMVRTNQPLVDRMTLIWHSWFATSIEGATPKLMLAQNRMMRSHALGNFHQLFLDVTTDPGRAQPQHPPSPSRAAVRRRPARRPDAVGRPHPGELAPARGALRAYCSLPGHEHRGMKAFLTVH
jgi:hypothetical protein